MIAAALLGSAALLPAQPAAAPTARTVIRMDAHQLLLFGEQAERVGNATAAESAYRSVARDPDRGRRAEARLRLARLLAAGGKRSQAAVQLRRVLDEQPDAAPVRLALAQLLASIGDEAAARRELRAVRAGELPLEVGRLVDRFSEALRVRKPLGARLEIAVAPDSNINRATRSDSVGTVIGPFDISDDGRQTSGVGVALRGQGYGRVAVADDLALLGRVSTSADLYRHSRYNDIALDFAAGPEFHVDRSRIRVELGATRRWFGDRPLFDSVRLAGSLSKPLGARTHLSLSGSAAVLDNRMNDLQSGKSYGGRAAIERALSPVSGVSLSLSGERHAALDPAYSTSSWRAGLLGWRELGRTTLTAAVEHGRLEADERLALFLDKRSDLYTRLSVGATLRQFSLGGFAPLVRASFERNQSSIEVYDYRRRRTEIGIARAF